MQLEFRTGSLFTINKFWVASATISDNLTLSVGSVWVQRMSFLETQKLCK